MLVWGARWVEKTQSNLPKHMILWFYDFAVLVFAMKLTRHVKHFQHMDTSVWNRSIVSGATLYSFKHILCIYPFWTFVLLYYLFSQNIITPPFSKCVILAFCSFGCRRSQTCFKMLSLRNTKKCIQHVIFFPCDGRLFSFTASKLTMLIWINGFFVHCLFISF